MLHVHSHPLAGMLNLGSWLYPTLPNSSPPQETFIHIPHSQPGPCLQVCRANFFLLIPSPSRRSPAPEHSKHPCSPGWLPRQEVLEKAIHPRVAHTDSSVWLPVSAGSLGLLGKLSSSFFFIILFLFLSIVTPESHV